MGQNGTPRDNRLRSVNQPQKNLGAMSKLPDEEEWEELDIKGGKKSGMSDWMKKIGLGDKKNANMVLGLSAGILLLAVVVVGWLSGWFGASTPQVPSTPAVAKQMEMPAQPPVTTPTAAEYQPPTPAIGSQDQPAETPTDNGEQSEQKPPEPLPPLSDDVSTWKKEDFFRARKENDPRLVLAIVYSNQKTRGSQHAARALAELLKPVPVETPKPAEQNAQPEGVAVTPGPMPPGPMPPGMEPGRMGPNGQRDMPPNMGKQPEMPGRFAPPDVQQAPVNPGDYAKLIETIIAALGENGTDAARDTLIEIVKGTFKTDDDKTAVEAALKMLIAHPSKESNALLIAAITSPETLRPAGQEGSWTAQDLQAKAFELIKTSPSVNLRTELADRMADQIVKHVQNNPIRDFFLEEKPVNCGAQLVLYEKKQINVQMRPKLEKQLTAYSGYALSHFLKIPNDIQGAGVGFGQPGGALIPPPTDFGGGGRERGGFPAINETANQQSVNEELEAAKKAEKIRENAIAVEVADLLWSDKFYGPLTERLAGLSSLNNDTGLMGIVATIPQDATRAALLSLLRKRWQEGPAALEQEGIFDQLMTDPGFLVLVKMMPRRDHGLTDTQIPAARPAVNRAGERVDRAPERGGEKLTALQKRAVAEQAWMNVSMRAVSAWRKRLQAAALAQKKAEEDWGLEAPKAEVPLPAQFALTKNAKVIASFDVAWPQDLPKDLAVKPGMLEIHYACVEETNVPAKALSYYARQAQARMAAAKPLENSVWFDTMRVNSENDGRRSVDVFVSRPHNTIADIMTYDLEDELIIEIMSIEIKNPVQ